ncbi:MAG TPA: acyltransferase [Solirubrobacteraceae bacterium]|nr:acyltransferase [Solirubrobacteraceae bacterium]
MSPSFSPALAPPPGEPRFPLFDGLRAIAILLVLATHAAGATGAIAFATWGPLGVQARDGVALFFAISGFLLYRPFVARRVAGRPAPSAGRYLWRRALRILPAYWVALTLLAIWPGLDGPFGDKWWVYYGFGQVYDPATAAKGITVAWSLCVEVTFYLLLPLYAAAVGWAAARTRRLTWVQTELAALALVGVIGLAFRALIKASVLPGEASSTLPALALWFVAGMALAVFSVERATTERRRPALEALAAHPIASWSLAAAAFVTTAFTFDIRPRPNYATSLSWGTVIVGHLLTTTAIFLFALPAVLGDPLKGWPRRVLAWRPIALLGLISYGVFLYHVPLLLQFTQWFGGQAYITAAAALAAVTLVAAGVAATLSYRLVELPFLRRKEVSLSWPRSRTPTTET